MPLVIPEINEAESEAMMAQLAVIISKTDEWTSKLVGKKLGDFHDETVCNSLISIGLFYLYQNMIDLCKDRFAE